MYNVFRHDKDWDYKVYYTDADGNTVYPGGGIIDHVKTNKEVVRETN